MEYDLEYIFISVLYWVVPQLGIKIVVAQKFLSSFKSE